MHPCMLIDILPFKEASGLLTHRCSEIRLVICFMLVRMEAVWAMDSQQCGQWIPSSVAVYSKQS